MASVTLRGRFRVGARVRLVRVEGPQVLRAQGGEVVAAAVVDDESTVRFSEGVVEGARYFVVGTRDGQPLEVRVTGKHSDDDTGLLAQLPVGLEPQRVGTAGTPVEAPAAVPDEPVVEEPAPKVGAKQAAKKLAAKPAAKK